MLGTLAKAAIWLLLATTIVVLGWDEPLRYLFMSQAAVQAEEQVFQPPKKKPSFFPSSNFRPNANPLSSPSMQGGRKQPEQGLKTHSLK